jgi:hypothetical protein
VDWHHKAREKEDAGINYAAGHDTSMIPGHKCPTAMHNEASHEGEDAF